MFQHVLVLSNTNLSVAVTGSDPDTVRYFISKFEPRHTYQNCLSAAAHGNVQVVETLIDNGFDIDCDGGSPIDPFDFNASSSPLLAAASAGNEAVVKLLLEKGALTWKRDSHGNTAADRAAENGHLEIGGYIRKTPSQW